VLLPSLLAVLRMKTVWLQALVVVAAIWDGNAYCRYVCPYGNVQRLLLRFVPRGAGQKKLMREFETLCELVYAWGRCSFVAEELANVTTPSWAPASWRKMTTSGRHREVWIYGVTQSPALVDKSFLGNCTLIHCCALREHAHRVAVAKAMDISDAEIATLVKFEYLEKDYETGQVTRESVTPPAKKPAKRAAKSP